MYMTWRGAIYHVKDTYRVVIYHDIHMYDMDRGYIANNCLNIYAYIMLYMMFYIDIYHGEGL